MEPSGLAFGKPKDRLREIRDRSPHSAALHAGYKPLHRKRATHHPAVGASASAFPSAAPDAVLSKMHHVGIPRARCASRRRWSDVSAAAS
jgi:hypothetical protein